MWSEETKTGIKYVERYIDPLTGKKKRVSITLTGKKTKKQERMAADILEGKIKAVYASHPDSKLTLGEVAEYYYKDQMRTVSEQTYIRNKFAVVSNLRMLGSDVLINNLTARYVRECYNASGKENGTLNEHMTRLKAFLRWAYRNDYIDDITWLQKLVPYEDRKKKEELEDKYLESEELAILLDGMQVKKWRRELPSTL